MAKSFQKSQFKIQRVRLKLRAADMSVSDLALMLEIDLMLNRRYDFLRRLQNALNDAARQGQKAATASRTADRYS